MKSIIFTLCTLLMFTQTTQANDSDDVKQLKNIKLNLWPKSYRNQDTALLDSILHENFQMTNNSGDHSNKEKEMEYIKNNEWQVASFSYEIYRLEIFNGHTAMVSGQGKTDRYTYHSSNVFIKENEQWKAISSHVSGYKELNLK